MSRGQLHSARMCIERATCYHHQSIQKIFVIPFSKCRDLTLIYLYPKQSCVSVFDSEGGIALIANIRLQNKTDVNLDFQLPDR